MFRMKSKKAAVQRRTTTTSTKDDDDDDDDDDEEGQKDMTAVIRSAQQRAKSKNGLRKKNANRHVSSTGNVVGVSTPRQETSTSAASRPKGGLAVVPPSLGTLQDEEEQEEEAMTSNSKKKSKRRRRMGYGGGGDDGGVSHQQQEEDAKDETESNNNDKNAYRYDRETLSKLKSEQQSLDLQAAAAAAAAAAEEKNQLKDSSMPPPLSSSQRYHYGERFSSGTTTSGEQPQHLQQQQHSATGTTSTGRRSRESMHEEDDYISMQQQQQHSKRTKPSSSWPSQPTILTGDDALRMAREQSSPGQEQEHDHEASAMEPAGVFASDWEAQVTRRAGLTSRSATAGSSAAAATAGHGGGAAGHNNTNSSRLSWMDLRSQFASTLQKLSTQSHDLDRLRERRLTETETAQAECQDRQVRVQQAGKALEFYQEWRHALVAWVGALRELHEKIPALQQAYNDLERDISALDSWKDWEDDVIYELWQAGRLDQVIGRQPDASLFTTTSTTRDEFGRNVKSQQVMAREKRQRHRKHIQQQRAAQRLQPRDDNNTSSNVLMVPAGAGGGVGSNNNNSMDILMNNVVADEHAHTSDEELEVLRERHLALQKALAVALEQIDVKYTRLQNLVDLFATWQQAYPQEYQACYASLTLADLASVLVSAEMIGSLNDPWNESCGYNEAKWTAVVHDASTPKSSMFSTATGATSTAIAGGVVFDEAGIERLVEKAVLPAVYSLLSKSGYNLISERQTRSLTNFLRYVQKILVPRRLDSPLATNNIDNSSTAMASSAIATTTTRVAVASVFNDDGSSNQSRHHYGRGSQVNSIIDSNDSSRSRSGKSLAMKSIHKCVVAYIRQFLDSIAIPLVGKRTQETEQEKALTENQKQQLEDALRAARVGQLHRIRTIIIHLLKYWAPLLGKDDGFAETVLYFCSTKLLLLLSSLNGLENEEATEGSSSLSSPSLGYVLWSTSDVFRQIWDLLQMQEGWMDRPEWMVQTITLRAAAEAYGVTNTK